VYSPTIIDLLLQLPYLLSQTARQVYMATVCSTTSEVLCALPSDLTIPVGGSIFVLVHHVFHRTDEIECNHFSCIIITSRPNAVNVHDTITSREDTYVKNLVQRLIPSQILQGRVVL